MVILIKKYKCASLLFLIFFNSKFMNNNNNFILALKIPFLLKSVFMLVEQPLQKHNC